MISVRILFLILLFGLALTILYSAPAEASHNPNLVVSVENSTFENTFTGSMVVEVVVADPNIGDTDEGKGEPDVTINGKDLRMVQATDGKWYAYFANLQKAKLADQIAFDSGEEGLGFDFGVFCDNDTASSVLGVSFSDTNGVAIPRSSGVFGFTNGDSSFSNCTGSPESGDNLNNVVRRPKSINTNAAIPTGQIGLDKDAWPIIQLFSFSDAVIQYNKAGGAQQVNLDYDEMENISLTLDRNFFPANAEVFVTITDMQLNQDPTSRDSWTFNVESPSAVFYQAFDENGNNSANGTPGLVNLISHLSSLDFEDNGVVLLNSGVVTELLTNEYQPETSVTDGTNTFSEVITFVESQPNTGIFENFDFSDQSTIGIKGDAPRGQSATISYNSESTSIVTGSVTASVSLDLPTNVFAPGHEYTVTIIDVDQNKNPGENEDLDVFRSTAIIPSLQIGNPLTLEKSSDVQFYLTSESDLVSEGISAPSSVPDTNSDRLVIDTTSVSNDLFEKVSVNLGISANDLQSLFIDVDAPGVDGTNWINFDLRSFQRQLDITNFSDTSFSLFFGLGDTTPVDLILSGEISNAQGLVQIDDSVIDSIESESGNAYLVINFDSSDNSSTVGEISNEVDTQPIVFDLFSFGEENNQEVNNAIYRFELEETSANSGTFTGTIEYSVTNQINLFDANFIKTLPTINDQVKFLVNDRLIDEEGIIIKYSDVANVGANFDIASQTDVQTSSGSVGLSSTFRLGHPVRIILADPDLNVDQDTIGTFFVINDPNSPNVDTVGDSSGNILLEILIKGVRYQRCTIDGIPHGGLGATGFTLTETGPATGIFEGVFRMPVRFCNEAGDELMSPAGGSVVAKYHDFSDIFGERNTYSTDRPSSSSTQSIPPYVNAERFTIPKFGGGIDVIVQGTIANYKAGVPVQITLIKPDLSSQDFAVSPTSQGSYRAIFSLNDDSMLGYYNVHINYLGSTQGKVSFIVDNPIFPSWIKNDAEDWSERRIGDSEFRASIEYLINENIISLPDLPELDLETVIIPNWFRNNASWWTDDLISEADFINGIKYIVEQG